MFVNAIPGLGQAVRVGGDGRRLIEVERGGGGRRPDGFPFLPDVEKQGRSRIKQNVREKAFLWAKIKRVDQLLQEHTRKS
jgi:hypothetical protein